MWCPVREIKWDFSLDDLHNRMRFARRIQQRADPVAQYLWDQFSEDTKSLFEALNSPLGGLVENPLIQAILSELDKVLERSDLYEPSRFEHVHWREEATQFVGKTLEHDEQIQFNRLLLESAYPYDLARSGTIEGLAAEIVHFFWDVYCLDDKGNPVPKTLHDFLDECSHYHYEQYPDLGLEIRRFCHNLIAEGFLYSVGFNPTQRYPYNEQFLSYFFSRELAAYGSYEFVAFGFPKVLEHFRNSIIRLDVLQERDSSIPCSSFVIPENRLVTASHCINPGARIAIDGWDPKQSPLAKIFMPVEYDTARPFVAKRGRIDVAIFQFERDPFSTSAKLGLWRDKVLDEVLVAGYPPLTGFNADLVAGTGQVISHTHSTARNQPLVMFSARVKRGNSGGPVLNQMGKVVGVVSHLLTDDEMKVDPLGYGLATPAQAILDLCTSADKGGEKVFAVPFSIKDDIIHVSDFCC
jgi:trypsin-like peptidase